MPESFASKIRVRREHVALPDDFFGRVVTERSESLYAVLVSDMDTGQAAILTGNIGSATENRSVETREGDPVTVNGLQTGTEDSRKLYNLFSDAAMNSTVPVHEKSRVILMLRVAQDVLPRPEYLHLRNSARASTMIGPILASANLRPSQFQRQMDRQFRRIFDAYATTVHTPDSEGADGYSVAYGVTRAGPGDQGWLWQVRQDRNVQARPNRKGLWVFNTTADGGEWLPRSAESSEWLPPTSLAEQLSQALANRPSRQSVLREVAEQVLSGEVLEQFRFTSTILS